MKQNKLINLLLFLIWLMQLFIEALVILGIQRLDILPRKYLLLLLGVLGALWLFVGLLLLCGRRGKLKGNILRSVGCILLAVIVAGCAIGTSLIADLQNTLHGITAPTPVGVSMQVYVLRDCPVQSITEAGDFHFGSVKGYEEERTQQVLDDVARATGKTPKQLTYSSVEDMVAALYSHEVDAIVLNQGYVSLLEEAEEYSSFSQRTRILHEVVTIIVPNTQDPKPPQETDPAAPQGITEAPFILYISGSDTRYDTLHTSRSDVNILAVVHPVTRQVLLLNTPRDYYVANPAGGGAKDKLTHCGLYGVDCSAQALADLYGIHVDYTAQINFSGFETLIDAIGGITVYSDSTFTADKSVHVMEGENHFNGREALAFARERHNGGGDQGRGRHQMQVISAVIKKMTSSTALITKYSAILDSLQGMFTTSLTQEDMSELVKMQLADMRSWNIQTYAVTGTGGSDVNYSMPGRKAYVMYPNMETVNRASDLVEKVLSGGILTSEDVK